MYTLHLRTQSFSSIDLTHMQANSHDNVPKQTCITPDGAQLAAKKLAKLENKLVQVRRDTLILWAVTPGGRIIDLDKHGAEVLR